VRDKKLAGALRHGERLARDAVASAAAAHAWLAPAEPGGVEAEPGTLERTWRASQAELATLAERGAARGAFDWTLPDLGPYAVDYSPSGRHLLLAGARGHLALADVVDAKLHAELFVRERVHDAVFLHNETFFAAAHGGSVFLYDKRGVELHAARAHAGATRLAFLKQHFLLASAGAGGVVRWQDVTTGEVVAERATRLGDTRALTVNPWNAVLVAGHGGGTVTMWTPNSAVPVVRMLAHAGPVVAAAVDPTGRHLVTAGADRQVRVFDVRTFKPLHAYYSRPPVAALAVSQRGLVAVASPTGVVVWRGGLHAKAADPYLRVDLPPGAASLRDVAFRPFEDVLAVGHGAGVRCALVPGAGEPNLDSFVADPYAPKRARQEGEVRALLDKLPADSIVLDPTSIGKVAREPKEVRDARAAEAAAANAAALAAARAKGEARAKMKGKNKPTRRQKKKQFVIVEERKAALRRRLGEADNRGGAGDDGVPADVPRALERLYRKH
jgi:U3 small nucleolar RNA-associated protein 7